MPDGLLPVLLGAAYLALLSAIALLTERVPRLSALARHPISVGLAMGVYATSWTFYGGVGLADARGYVFLTISLGVVLSCLAIPVLWRPLGRLVRARRLQSAADLLAFRFQSQGVGAAVALFMVLGLLPYLSLQMRAIADAAAWIGDGAPWTGPAFALLLAAFAMGLGARYAEPRSHRPGLLATLAVESLIKVAAITVVGGVVLFEVFDGPAGLDRWLESHPEALAHLYRPVHGSPWVSLLLVAFVAAFLLPRQFHVAFVEQGHDPDLRRVMWVLPTLLLALHLPLPVLYLAGGLAAPPGSPPDVYVLVASARPWVRGVAFLGGISASSAMILVTSVALSGMVVNHLILPLRPLARRGSADYRRLTALRRAVMAALVFAGLAVHLLAPRVGTLADLGLISFTAVLQLLPGVLATLFWPRATRRGLWWGLLGGAAVWLLDAGPPLLGHAAPDLGGWLPGVDHRAAIIWLSLGLNATLFVIGSLTAPPGRAEAEAAAFCADPDAPPSGAVLGPDALRRRLALVLGPDGARRELSRHLDELGLARDERRPAELQRLSARVEHDLSGLVGPLAAQALVGRHDAPAALAAELRYVQQRTARAAAPPRGVQRSLARVQRYLAAVLDELPVGVCALDDEGHVVVWNRALARQSGLDPDAVAGAALDDLPAPWAALLGDARAQPDETIERNDRGRILRLRCAPLPEADRAAVLLAEDITARRALRAQAAHQDRLASIGRLAAGVAHEIRNPLTGIVMVARNLRLEPDADDAGERLDLIIGEADRIDAIVRTLLGFSRDDGVRAPEAAPVDLPALVRDAVELVRLDRRARRLDWRVDAADDPALAAVPADRQRLLQVLVNLLANARDAAAARVDVRLARDGQWVDLAIVDDGPGVPPEHAGRVFEPFFTTKPPGEGTGLGLAVCHRIVDEHRGAITLEPDAPTTFRVRLPLVRRSSSAPPAGPPPTGAMP